MTHFIEVTSRSAIDALHLINVAHIHSVRRLNNGGAYIVLGKTSIETLESYDEIRDVIQMREPKE